MDVYTGFWKRLFPQIVFGHWNRLLRAAVTEPNLSESKKYFDNAFRHTVAFLGCSSQGQELDFDDPYRSLQT